jgi:hypothetical protein
MSVNACYGQSYHFATSQLALCKVEFDVMGGERPRSVTLARSYVFGTADEIASSKEKQNSGWLAEQALGE